MQFPVFLFELFQLLLIHELNVKVGLVLLLRRNLLIYNYLWILVLRRLIIVVVHVAAIRVLLIYIISLVHALA